MAKPDVENVSVTTPYSEEYKEKCFTVWVAAGEPHKSTFLHKHIPEDEYGRKPTVDLLRIWRREYDWDARADLINARAAEIIDDDLVAMKVHMLRNQAARGSRLQKLGMDYLLENGFDTASSAVQAVVRGANLERTSRGLSDALIKIAEMSDDKLTGEFQKLLEKASKDGKIIDVAEVKNEKQPDK